MMRWYCEMLLEAMRVMPSVTERMSLKSNLMMKVLVVCSSILKNRLSVVSTPLSSL